MPQFSSLWGRLLTQELGSEDSTVLFTDARRQNAVRDGLREFAELTECLALTSTITITGGTGEYDLNSSLLSTSLTFVRFASNQSVEFHYTDASSHTTYLSGDDLPLRDVRWLNRYEPSWRDSTLNSSGMQVPILHYVRQDGPALFLGFYPVPSTGSSASAKVIVPYVPYTPVPSTNTDEPYTINSSVRVDLRPYHVAAVHYAAHQLEKLRRDDQASDRQLQKFMAYVQRYWQAMRKKGGSSLTYARLYFRRGLRLQGEDPRT